MRKQILDLVQLQTLVEAAMQELRETKRVSDINGLAPNHYSVCDIAKHLNRGVKVGEDIIREASIEAAIAKLHRRLSITYVENKSSTSKEKICTYGYGFKEWF